MEKPTKEKYLSEIKDLILTLKNKHQTLKSSVMLADAYNKKHKWCMDCEHMFDGLEREWLEKEIKKYIDELTDKKQ